MGPKCFVSLPQLPPDEAHDRRELDLQAMKLGPLQPIKGYSSPEIDAASGRALTLCRSLGDRAKLFPVLYARWAFQYVMGRNREAFVLSREYLEAARASGDDAPLIVGQRIHAAGLLMRGDAEGARGLAREAVQRRRRGRLCPVHGYNGYSCCVDEGWRARERSRNLGGSRHGPTGRLS